MSRRLLLAVILVCCCSLLTGCWSYWGLDEMVIVTGLAIDKKPTKDGYHLTIEIVDTKSASNDSVEVQYVETEGATLFAAFRNAKRRLSNKLYGGNMELIVISKELAAEEGVLFLLEEFLRDDEPRETLNIAISLEDTASKVLLSEGIESSVVSYEMNESLEEDNEITSSTRYVPLYKAYSAIKAPGKSLVLPALCLAANRDKQTVETHGIALFRGDKLSGFLTPEKTLYYLFFVNEVKGGVINFGYDKSEAGLSSAVIKESHVKKRYELENGQLTIKLKVRVVVNITETKSQVDLRMATERKHLEQQITAVITDRIHALFSEVQQTMGYDIFGFGSMVYQKEPDLWRMVEADWDNLFRAAKLEVDTQVDLFNTGVLKAY